jgi:hypothetical protein
VAGLAAVDGSGPLSEQPLSHPPAAAAAAVPNNFKMSRRLCTGCLGLGMGLFLMVVGVSKPYTLLPDM